MKFVCNRCNKLVIDQDVIIIFQGNYTFANCLKCYKEAIS